jgi:serine/threonine protein kinase
MMNTDVNLKEQKTRSLENFTKPNLKKRFSRQLLKRISLESSLEAKRYDSRSNRSLSEKDITSPRYLLNSVTSPRIQVIQNMLCDSKVYKKRQLAKGYGSNAIIWDVNVSIDNDSMDPFTLEIKESLKRCCMKEINISQCCGDDLNLFMMEIDKLQRLPNNNNNIIQFIGYCKTPEYVQIFTKLYEGSLGDLINERSRLNEKFTQEEIIDFMKQIASGLMVLHSRRMMHRDLKSDNIFYYRNGNDIILALGDFGESKIIDRHNKAKTCAGTNVWMAPEVLESFSKNEYTFNADIYSLGMVMYEFMTLSSPYHEMKGFSAVLKILKGEKPNISAKDRDRYKDIIELWNKMVDMTPENRPSSAQIYCVKLLDIETNIDKNYVDL